MLEAVPWENPTYGILGRAAGNVAYGGTVNPPRNRKGGAGNLHLRVRAPALYPTGASGVEGCWKEEGLREWRCLRPRVKGKDSGNITCISEGVEP